MKSGRQTRQTDRQRDRQTERQIDRRRRIWAHRANSTGGLKNCNDTDYIINSWVSHYMVLYPSLQPNENTPAFMHLPHRTFLSPFVQITSFFTSHDAAASWCNVTYMTSWHNSIGQGFVSCNSNQNKVSRIVRKSHFLTCWPWPLTYDLDHHTWPRYDLGWCPCKISCP